MKLNTIAAALALVLAASASAHAGNERGRFLAAGPIPVAPTEDLLISVFNPCKSTATYSLTITNTADGSVLKADTGTIESGRSASILLGSTATEDLTTLSVATTTCRVRSSTPMQVVLSGAIVDKTTHESHALFPFATLYRK